MNYSRLNPDKALIWRIVHRDNLPWILDNGLHCDNSGMQATQWVNIDNTELLDKRRSRHVPIAPGGVLADYVPFCFTPFSVMMRNIHSGWSVQQRSNEEIVILVSSLYRVEALGLPFVFTNALPDPVWASYYSDLAYLGEIDWPLLQRRDIKRDPDDPRKMERYQAEALIHHHLPITGLLGIMCYNDAVKARIEHDVAARGLTLPVHARPGWYFQ
ncbi:TPA: DUF4433 domain-containing protein [Pseudomonas putida]|nr:DUF4433 domain-containing protein [Pseudomonas putida]